MNDRCDWFEVYFYQFCRECKHKDKEATDEPCFECLGNPVNEGSHKPINFEKKDK